MSATCYKSCMYLSKRFVGRGETLRGPYWDLRRSVRVDGKPHTIHVRYIGRAETKREAGLLARQKGILCGAWGCRQPGEVEISVSGGKARLCREHLDEVHRAELGDPAGCSEIVALVG